LKKYLLSTWLHVFFFFTLEKKQRYKWRPRWLQAQQWLFCSHCGQEMTTTIIVDKSFIPLFFFVVLHCNITDWEPCIRIMKHLEMIDLKVCEEGWTWQIENLGKNHKASSSYTITCLLFLYIMMYLIPKIA